MAFRAVAVIVALFWGVGGCGDDAAIPVADGPSADARPSQDAPRSDGAPDGTAIDAPLDASAPDAQLPEIACDDGTDNDGDGLIDCADSDCNGRACNDGSLCTMGETCSAAGACVPAATVTCNTPPACATAPGTCDPQSGQCSYAPSSGGTICRAATGPCDVAEMCDGASTSCPPDALATTGTVCRAAAGACDVAETCSGTDAGCPVDVFAPMTTMCRPAAGVCDVPESCTGSDPDCPPNGFVAGGTACRASAGPCDLADLCSGTAPDCPNEFVAAGTICRMSTEPCDAAEACTGASAACPPDDAPFSAFGGRFDAFSSRLIVTSSPSLDFGTGSWTIEFWLNADSLIGPSSAAEGIRIFDRSAGCWPAAPYWVVDIPPPGTPEMEVTGRRTNGALIQGDTRSSGTMSAQAWTHVAIVVDRTLAETRYYLNGAAAGTSLMSPEFATSTVSNTCNLSFSSAWNAFTGTLDEVRLWSTARTTAQIQAGMCAALTGTESNLIGYWPMESDVLDHGPHRFTTSVLGTVPLVAR